MQKNYKLTLAKEIGNLWTLKDITPFRKPFEVFYDKDLGRDIGKLMTICAANLVLDTIAGDDRSMEVDLKLSAERMKLPSYVEFELVQPFNLSAKYHVNNCPGHPQMIAWFNASAKDIFAGFPAFAYIRKN